MVTGMVLRFLLKLLILILAIGALGLAFLTQKIYMGFIIMIIGVILISIVRYYDRKARIYYDEIIRVKARRKEHF